MILKNYVDYDILKNNLSQLQLDYIGMVIDDYVEYQTKYDDGIKDIIGEFINNYKYSVYDIISWYEGLDSTEDLIRTIKELEW